MILYFNPVLHFFKILKVGEEKWGEGLKEWKGKGRGETRDASFRKIRELRVALIYPS